MTSTFWPPVNCVDRNLRMTSYFWTATSSGLVLKLSLSSDSHFLQLAPPTALSKAIDHPRAIPPVCTHLAYLIARALSVIIIDAWATHSAAICEISKYTRVALIIIIIENPSTMDFWKFIYVFVVRSVWVEPRLYILRAFLPNWNWKFVASVERVLPPWDLEDTE